jgi:hypothetical protein
MEKWDRRLFQQDAAITGHDDGWNIVELESRRDLRQKIDALIDLSLRNAITTSELHASLSDLLTHYGQRFVLLLVRCLSTKNEEKRQTVVQLITLLNTPEALPHLESLAHSEQTPRSIRLSASLALAGMGSSSDIRQKPKRVRSYAIS